MELLISPSEYKKSKMIICKGLNDLMKRFVHKRLVGNYYLINMFELDKRIRMLAKYIVKHNVLIVNRNKLFFPYLERAKEYLNVLLGRFLPGSFTNPNSPNFLEPDAVLVFNVKLDKQAIREALEVNIPIFGLCSLNDDPTYLDFILPINNKNRKSISTFIWLLIREIKLIKGEIKSYKEFPSIQEFYKKVTTKT